MIIDHIGLTVSDMDKSKTFYRQALAALGIDVVMEVQGWVGMGRDGQPAFWFGPGERPGGPIHIAFATQDRQQVQAFYDAALRAGGRDNGPPGIRAHYHANYYAAFVFDPDGNNVEAVCHKPQ